MASLPRARNGQASRLARRRGRAVDGVLEALSFKTAALPAPVHPSTRPPVPDQNCGRAGQARVPPGAEA